MEVQGIVQGVGFRPFIYALALRHGLAGWVCNDIEGVQIEVEGEPEALDAFLCAVTEEAPPLAVIESLCWQACGVQNVQGFQIAQSHVGQSGALRHALISPDVALCADCLHELLDPADRRYRYPFINCTNCGPRFTITRSVPYDRATTTMAGFPMCRQCRGEYENPLDRRFHAQPNACPVCGPQVRLYDASGQEITAEDVIRTAALMLRQGVILAVKGLGGYHLACNPFDSKAVTHLRERKARQDRPFALMVSDLAQAQRLCRICPEEEALLTSPARPIVLLESREDSEVVEAVAPRQKTLGLMLAYTPLHSLLLQDTGIPLVMTSGNRSDEPIAYRDEEAREQLAGIAEGFLTHNRPIHMRCDDSLVRVCGGSAYPLRRSRGYAPAPLGVATQFPRHVLACGGELKNTFCLAKERHVFLSHHIGDLENYETLRSFHEGIDHFRALFDVQPEIVAYDLHPNYLSTQYALEQQEAGLPVIGIQHHQAHIASCLADNERPDSERVIGVALDGTGYGTDGALWGAEFFTGSIQDGFQRRAHLQYMPLPGGEAAIRQPWRMALAQLIRIYGEQEALHLPLPLVQTTDTRNVRTLARLLEYRLNTPLTSSAGRLFDTVSALLGLPGTLRTTYEGQAAVELELAALRAEAHMEAYPVRLQPDGEGWIIETDPILIGVVEDMLADKSVGEIAARFHQTMAEIVVTGCVHLRKLLLPAESGSDAVALSGGTFQNLLLLNHVLQKLEHQGFTVYRHRRVPTNDGGLSLGQAVLANRQFQVH